MDIQQLRYFIVIASYGKIQTAADALFVSRQAVSKALTQLEEELGYPLFYRAHSGVTLTLQGAAYIDQARAVVEDFDALSAQMRRTDTRCRLRIALPFTVHHGFFDQLDAFRTANADKVTIDIISRTDAGCHTLFESGAVDMAISHIRFHSGLDEGTLVASSPICIAVHKDDPIANLPLINKDTPFDRKFIYYMNGYEELSWLTHPQCDYAVNDIMLAFDLVLKRKGVFPIPRISAHECLDGIVFVPFEGPDDRDDFYCSIAPHVARNAHLETLCRALRDALVIT